MAREIKSYKILCQVPVVRRAQVSQLGVGTAVQSDVCRIARLTHV